MKSFRVLIEGEAKKEIEEALNWYGEKDPDLEKIFFDELDQAFSILEHHPYQWPEIKRGAHRMVMRHFPFSIFYLVHDTDVRVFAVHHHRQNETRWTDRTL